MEGDVSYAGLATSLALVGVAAGISLWQRLGLERQILWAAARALVPDAVQVRARIVQHRHPAGRG
jgi:ABC-type iron transport system FetAB permease component